MSLTDTFYSRYTERRLAWGRDGFPPPCATVLRQATHILFQDLHPHLNSPEEFWRSVHDQLVRELATFALADGNSYEERCGRFLAETYDLWRDGHGDHDYYFKTRVSLIELALQRFEATVEGRSQVSKAMGGIFSWRESGKDESAEPTEFERAVRAAVDELNTRFRQAQIGLAYHDGHIQLMDDEATADAIEKPFWELLRGPKWKNVRIDMKEAIDRRDTQGRDAALYALKALESIIKVIGDEKGFTRGTERGASSFVDNLMSAANGRLIEPWEGEQLKALFKHLRNPHSHGPGSGKQPRLTEQQQTWVIDSVMAWAKSLIRRM